MRKRLKYGRLYWMPLEAKDLGRDFLWRVFNKFGIKYIPFTLRFYDELYLREDISKYSRRLIYECRKWGVVTYVVQEGPIQISGAAEFGLIPLYADNFLCPKEDCEYWVKAGMPKQRIKAYKMQKPKKEDYEGVVFLEPFLVWKDKYPENYKARHNIKVAETICKMMDEDVIFKLPESRSEIVEPILQPYRITKSANEDLIRKYNKIYCFSGSSIIELCRKAGKKCEIIVKNNSEDDFIEREKSPSVHKSKEDYDGVAFLLPFDVLDNIGFPCLKPRRELKIIKGIYDMMNKDVLFKPHQANPELIEPFLPPHRIIWDTAEELIRKYDKIYCFSACSIRKDCEMLGKEYELIDKEN